MRASIIAFILSAILLGAPVAMAAPTCQDVKGDTLRCGTPGAMPVGWSPSPEALWDRKLALPQGPDTNEVLKALGGIALLLALIALLPRFDGSPAGGGWDRQEGDKQGDDEDPD